MCDTQNFSCGLGCQEEKQMQDPPISQQVQIIRKPATIQGKNSILFIKGDGKVKQTDLGPWVVRLSCTFAYSYSNKKCRTMSQRIKDYYFSTEYF